MSSTADTPSADPDGILLPLPLDAWHRERRARMVPFAGYSMPLLYDGIVAEHQWARASAALFDVSHMGQIEVSGAGASEALEALLPADLQTLSPGRARYSLLLSEDGGIRDDLIITRLDCDDADAFFIVVNGATKRDDLAHLRAHLPKTITLTHIEDRALLALQGPQAAAVLEDQLPGIGSQLAFMEARSREWRGHPLWISRSGYTGEDGFEIALPSEAALALASALTSDERVRPAGLGARDSLRLEAGLPLYGHDLDTGTDPISAGLAFAIARRRRSDGGFAGSIPIARLLEAGPPEMRVGLALDGRQPVREGASVFAGDREIGRVTSGGFSPTLGHPIAMAYVSAAHTAPGSKLTVEVRQRRLDAVVAALPFVPHNYHRAGATK